LEQLASAVRNIQNKNYQCSILFPPWDFKALFEDHISDFPNINHIRMLKITKEGVYSKSCVNEKKWSDWRGTDDKSGSHIEPKDLFKSIPNICVYIFIQGN